MSWWRRLTAALGGAPKADAPVAPAPAPAAREAAREAAPAIAKPRRPRPPEILGQTFDHPGHGIAGATPIADVWIQGLPCAAHTAVSFHRNGRVSSVILARAHEVGGELLPAGATVAFDTGGRPYAWIATRPEAYATRILDARKVWQPITLPAGSAVTVEHGQLRAVTLAGPITFDGLAFPRDTDLTLGDSGALSHVTCPEPVELRGIRWAAHETVVFEFGHLREGYPEVEGTCDDVPYQAGEIVRFHDNGRLARCYLARDCELSGVPCLGGTRIYRDDHGHLLEGTLAIDTSLAGVPVAADSVVGLEAGVVTAVVPREDCEVDGVRCAKGQLVELTTDGRLVRATLARDEVRDHWRLPAGSIVALDHGRLRRLVVTDATTPDGRALAGIWRVDLDDAGVIQSLLPITSASIAGTATLREATTIAGLPAAAGSNVELRPDGTVKSVVLATDQRVGAVVARSGTRVHFHDNQTPSNVHLADDTRVDDIPCAGARTLGVVMNDVEHTYREEVRLDDTGRLRFATLAEDTTVAGIPLARGHTLARWPNGALHVGTLAKRWTHALGCVARERTLLGLFEDGSPSLLTLAEAFTFDGTAHPAGTVLTFAAPGVLGSIESTHVPLGACDPIEPPG